MGHSEGSPKREVHSDTGLPKKDRNISSKQPDPTSTRTRGKKTKPRVNRRKEITKIRAELNDIETNRKFKGSINTGAGSLKRQMKLTSL